MHNVMLVFLVVDEVDIDVMAEFDGATREKGTLIIEIREEHSHWSIRFALLNGQFGSLDHLI